MHFLTSKPCCFFLFQIFLSFNCSFFQRFTKFTFFVFPFSKNYSLHRGELNETDTFHRSRTSIEVQHTIINYILECYETNIKYCLYHQTYILKQILNFDVTTGSLIEKYLTISINFQIRISQVIAKIELKQRRLNRIRHCLKGHIQI